MDIVAETVSDLQYAVSEFKQQYEQLGAEQAALMLPELGLTARDLLADVLGWQQYALQVLPEMLQSVELQLQPLSHRTTEPAPVSGEITPSLPEMLQKLDARTAELVTALQRTSSEALTMRRLNQGKIFTVKSYVVDLLVTRIEEYATQLKMWREELAS